MRFDERRIDRRWNTIKVAVRRLVVEDDAQDIVEYALLCGFIALSSIVAVRALGTVLVDVFTTVSSQLAVE